MTDWVVGLSTGCFFRMSLFEVLAEIRGSGFAVLEITSSRQHLDYHDTQAVRRAAQELRDLSLLPFSYHAPFPSEIDIASLEPARQSESVRELLRSAEAAAALGARHIVVHPGPSGTLAWTEQERPHRLARVLEALSTLARRCRELGLFVALENMLPNPLFRRAADLLWILGALGEPNVRLCLDSGHANIAGELYRLPRLFGSNLRLVHAADNHGRADEHLAPGEGSIDWLALAGELKVAQFTGTLMIELADVGTIHDILRRAAQARRMLFEVARSLELGEPPPPELRPLGAPTYLA